MVHIKDDQHIEYNIVYKGGIKQTWNLKKKKPSAFNFTTP